MVLKDRRRRSVSASYVIRYAYNTDNTKAKEDQADKLNVVSPHTVSMITSWQRLNTEQPPLVLLNKD
jgi:hypothetical protein